MLKMRDQEKFVSRIIVIKFKSDKAEEASERKNRLLQGTQIESKPVWTSVTKYRKTKKLLQTFKKKLRILYPTAFISIGGEGYRYTQGSEILEALPYKGSY